jgi:hypothetical protein
MVEGSGFLQLTEKLYDGTETVLGISRNNTKAGLSQNTRH